MMKMKTQNIKAIAACTAGIMAITALPLQAAESKRESRKANPWIERQAEATRESSREFERLNRLLGSDVLTRNGERAGKVNNMVLDLESGRVLFVVVGTGSGSNQRVAVPPGAFSDVRGDSLRLKVNREKLANAPKFDRDDKAEASFVNEVHKHFDQPAWWKGEGSASEGSFNNVQPGSSLVGMNVVNVQDTPVGKVNNAVIDLKAGRIAYVVVDPANEMNAGDKLFAFPPSALTKHKNGKHLTVDTNKEKLLSGPSFQKGQWPDMADRSFASRVYKHYGKQAYFGSDTGSGLTPTGSDSQRTYQDSDKD
jgi:sporulation protein YlmC with PRC-barrel domain